jgi:hypothetical protein
MTKTEDILDYARVASYVLGQLLKPHEGMIVRLEPNEESSDGENGRYMIWNNVETGNIVFVNLTPDDPEYELPNGRLMWVNKPPE